VGIAYQFTTVYPSAVSLGLIGLQMAFLPVLYISSFDSHLASYGC
jgi:hypothetical protein